MASDLEVRRLNLWIKSLPDICLRKSSEELIKTFQELSVSEIEDIDKMMAKKPTLVIRRRYNRDDFHSPSAFRSAPSSSKSSGSESTGYRSTP